MSQKDETIPTTQRAWVIEKLGIPRQALRLHENRPVPKLETGQALVKIQAAALNPLGWKSMGVLPQLARAKLSVPEYDFAGVVVDHGDTTFKRGDLVFGSLDPFFALNSGEGTLAEYVRVPSSALALRPAGKHPVDVAGIPLAGQTALQALSTFTRFEANQCILINGGSTAVGMYAIQIAKAKGAKVVVTCSPRHNSLMKDLGADETIDYTAAPLHEILTRSPPDPQFNIILDAVGLLDPSLYTHSPAYLAPGGVFVTTGPQPKSFSANQLWLAFKTAVAVARPAWLGGVPRGYKFIVMQTNQRDLDELRELCEAGKLRSVVDSVTEFDNVLEAYDRSMSGHAQGKVVVKIAD
ncbi:NAD(P)-binding protein [Pluteus cervinus]|uniref:NAD(P)-binding protein n=1 Tax=Pluteus cervinus TaxID=181527 RepID=A0ACD3B997_9AGAR|nr:NAD(P)-binding protein [Pluteus cervinus]